MTDQCDKNRPENAPWWRGNLHSHSLWSDGADFPEMASDRYKKHGYHFLALTEHDQLALGDRWIPLSDPRLTPDRLDACVARFGPDWIEFRDGPEEREVRLKPLDEYRHLIEEPGRFMLMTGEEITVRTPGRVASFINLWNAPEPLSPLSADDKVAAMQQTIRAAQEQMRQSGRRTGLHLNHPNWKWNCTAEEIAALDGLRFVEIFTALGSTNSHGDPLRASAERIWDVALSLRLGKLGKPVIYGLATDDAHDYDDPHSTSNRAWIMVRATRLTPQTIIVAMEEGDFYASTGVALADLRCQDRTLSLQIRPEPGVTYRTEFIGTPRSADLASTPVRDESGNELLTTRCYAPEVGRVLSQTEGTRAEYRLTDDDLYIRARVTSNKPHPLPHRPDDTETAWTQPLTP